MRSLRCIRARAAIPVPVRRHLPHLVTVSRGLAGPVVVWLRLSGDDALAFALFVVAMLTDLIDGRLAAAWGADRALGALLDPAADKVLGACAWAALWVSGGCPPWLAGFFLARDVVFGVGWLWLAGGGVRLTSSRLGMVATSYEATAIGLLLFPLPWFGVHWGSVGTWIGLAAMTLALGSAATYLVDRRTTVA